LNIRGLFLRLFALLPLPVVHFLGAILGLLSLLRPAAPPGHRE
jgi:hypothetical protein